MPILEWRWPGGFLLFAAAIAALLAVASAAYFLLSPGSSGFNFMLPTGKFSGRTSVIEGFEPSKVIEYEFTVDGLRVRVVYSFYTDENLLRNVVSLLEEYCSSSSPALCDRVPEAWADGVDDLALLDIYITLANLSRETVELGYGGPLASCYTKKAVYELFGREEPRWQGFWVEFDVREGSLLKGFCIFQLALKTVDLKPYHYVDENLVFLVQTPFKAVAEVETPAGFKTEAHAVEYP
ncbi:hypothetical protein apy_11620 [Aeropyrum pernix]|uniref:Uncharacterized protein n=1 Tax=Aeropyrum pernix TaxID=56636 RepID=A0A401HAK5_AERPX|nr:hypothetical protein [Aeropyrum pernix]GBF09437.1 hypothetical protein apy_11620 [Aeropyrum pernix]